MTVLTNCGNTNKDNGSIIVKPPKLQEIHDGSALNDAIESITSSPALWTQQRYDTIRTKINSLYAARVIESAEAPSETLYLLSVSCLYDRVDKEFRKPQYLELETLKDDLRFLNKENQFLYSQGVMDYRVDPKLAKIEDIFNNYEHVLSLSKSNFVQTPMFLRAYTGDYSKVKEQIEGNKYYPEYFSKNSVITGGVKEFPTRLTSARKNYYSDLEKIIEKRIEYNNLSSIECYKILGDFQKMAENSNKVAFDTLSAFVTKYIKQLDATESK